MKHTIITKAAGGWGYHLDVSKEQARQILEAKNGQVINLNGPDETISVSNDGDEIGHDRKTPTGRTCEDLDAANFREKLRDLLDSVSES